MPPSGREGDPDRRRGADRRPEGGAKPRKGRAGGDRAGGRPQGASGGGAKRRGEGGGPPRRSAGAGPAKTGRGGGSRRGDITVRAGGSLPKWVREEIVRSTPNHRRQPAIELLTTGLEAFADDRFTQAAVALRAAKDLAPRAATVREMLGLAAYQIANWDEALRELRTFRRLTGETIHMAVELDCLRALGRDDQVRKAWSLFEELGGSREAEDEARVVYASHLLDRGSIPEAWRVIKPGRLIADPSDSTLRRWAVAARVAAAAGDTATAHQLVNAIRRSQPDLPWLGELDDLLG